MLTRNQASLLVTLLDVATENNWPVIAEKMTGEERGEKPKDICEAWQELERIAGMSGTAPTEADF